MKLLITLSLFLFSSCATVASQPTVGVSYGFRDFDDSSEHEDTDVQEALGFQLHFAGKNGFGPELGVIHSSDVSYDPIYINRSVNDTTTRVRDLFFGFRKNHMLTDNIQIYGSGGISSVRVSTYVDLDYAGTLQSHDTTYAPYVQLGGAYFFNDNLNFGASYRRHFLDQESDIFINNPTLDGGVWLLNLEYGF